MDEVICTRPIMALGVLSKFRLCKLSKECLSMEARVSKFSNRPHHNHMPHMDQAVLILLVVFVASVALVIGAGWVYRALLS